MLVCLDVMKAGRDTFSKAYIDLKRSTYLPQRYYVVQPNRRNSTDYSRDRNLLQPARRRCDLEASPGRRPEAGSDTRRIR